MKGIGSSWRSTCPRVAVGPIVPQPEAGGTGNVACDGLLKYAINIEVGVASHPVHAVFVESGACIAGSAAVYEVAGDVELTCSLVRCTLVRSFVMKAKSTSCVSLA